MARIIKGPKFDVEPYKKGLGAYFFEAADKYPENIFHIDAETDTKETFSGVRQRSVKLAINLRKHGLNKGDIVMLCYSNNLNSAVPYLAGLYLGASISSLDPTLSLTDCQHCIKIVPPKFIFVEENSLTMIEKCLKNLQSNAKIIVMGKSKTYLCFHDLLQSFENEKKFKPVIVDGVKDTALIYFSSGTSGLPKGICLPHWPMLQSMILVSNLHAFKADVVLTFTSFYWISGTMFFVLSHITGGCRILSSKVSPQRTLEIIEKYKVTSCFMAPILSYGLLAVPNKEQYDLSSLYSICVGGTPMSKEKLIELQTFFKHSYVFMCYGLTETCGFITTFNLKNDKDLCKTKIGSSGKPYPEVRIKVVDLETREILPPYIQGEIYTKLPMIMSGYYNLDSTDCFDQDGYLKTGDVGYYDEDDCLYVVDRIKELLKYQSWHVVPSLIEMVLLEHPYVLEAVVFGIPHETDGDHPAACVVLKNNCKLTIDSLEKFVNERVSEKQKLRGGIKIVNSIPKTPSGKIMRRKMKEIHLSTY